MSRYMTLEDAVARVVKDHGGIRATERALGLDKSFLSRLMRGLKVNPSAETLAKLGLRAVPRYERIASSNAGVQPSANAAEVIDGMTRLIDQWHNGVKVPDMWMAAAAGALSAARALLADGVPASDGGQQG